MSRIAIGIVVAMLAGVACVSIWSAAHGPTKWTPDALFYETRVLEIRGADHATALERTFDGPMAAQLRHRDPHKTGNHAWVHYNEPFYERRLAIPLAAAALYPAAGDRSLLYVSLAGYVATVLAVFGLLLLRFRIEIAAAVAAATAVLPPLVHHSSFPLTDSWGIALEVVAFAAALLTLERNPRWLALWVGSIALLAFVRDSAWIPILAAGWCAFRYRSRLSLGLFASGLLAALPALLLFTAPVRDLLALLVNQSQVPSDTSWGFILGHYPGALLELVRANVGFLRRGEWYTAAYFAGGLGALVLLRAPQGRDRVWRSMFLAAAVAAVAYVLAAPVFSAFRLELVAIPAVAYGLARLFEVVAARVSARRSERSVPVRVPARIRR